MPENVTHRVGINGPVVKQAIADNPNKQWVVLWLVPGEGFREDSYRPAGGFTDDHAAAAYAQRAANGRKWLVMEKVG